MFNAATLPIYWRDLEPVQGQPRFSKDSAPIFRRPPMELCLEYCRENDIHPKAHCLNYFQRCHYPTWCPENDIAQVKRLCEKRFEELAAHYASRVEDWEVINETLGSFICADNPPIFFEPDSIEWSFELAKKYFPHNRLIINDDTPSTWGDQRGDRSTYYLQIERALSRGTPIDVIGMQCYFIYERSNPALCDRTCNPKKLFDIMDLYAQFGLPIQVTETEIATFSEQPEDEEIQAELLRQLYSIWFSHQAVESIVYWDIVDGYLPGSRRGDMNSGWNPMHSGLLRPDLSEKPAFGVLRDLFTKQWHTEACAVADEGGRACFRGFYGTYRLEIEANGEKTERRAVFAKGGPDEIEVVI